MDKTNKKLEKELQKAITETLKSKQGFIIICDVDKDIAHHAFANVCECEVMEPIEAIMLDAEEQGLLINHQDPHQKQYPKIHES